MHESRLRLDGRVAVVTGAAQGIGEATALAMADLGAQLAICDRDAEGLASTASAVEDRGVVANDGIDFSVAPGTPRARS